MKRAMSLLLALAMVMSFFTVGAFAGTGESAESPLDLTVSAAASEIIVGAKTTVSVTKPTYTKDETNYEYNEKFTWSAVANADGKKLTGSIAADDLSVEVSAAAAGDYEISCALVVTATPKEGEAEPTKTYYEGTASIKVIADNFEMKFTGDATKAQTLALVPGDTGTLTVDAKLYSKASEGVEAAEVTSGVTYTVKSTKTSVATVSGTTVTAVAGGSANIVVEASYKGKTYTKTIAEVTVATIGITEEILNGYQASYNNAATSLVAKIQSNINTVLKTTADTKITLRSVSITPAANSIFTVKLGTSTTATTSAFALTSADYSVNIAAKAGSIDTEEWTYTAVDTNGNDYTGTLTLKSVYVDKIEVEQDALFTKEWFYLGSLGSSNRSIRELREYSDDVKAYDEDKVYAAAGYTGFTGSFGYKVTPDYTDKAWTENFIGYDEDHRAYLVDVKYDAAVFDMSASAENAVPAFVEESDFLTFVESVFSEQHDNYSRYSALTVESVEFGTSTDYDFYDGTKKITSSSYECKDLSKVSIKAKTAGIYYVDFRVNVKYKATTNSSSYSYDTVDGVMYLLVSSEGDIQYETSYNDSVTFETADFLAYYKKATETSSAKLTRVTFTGLPLYGTLYSDPNRYTSIYKVDVSDVFYTDPNELQMDLGYVTYLAPNTPKTEYSVYVPFSAYGTKGTVNGVVEIIVNGALPFIDIPNTHTFYEHIKYVYKEGIMNGKTQTRFDASSSVTRLQLVRTLYRMAGSPTTHNNKTISFTDCKSLTGEAASALKWAVNNGIVNGYGDLFKPNDSVTRQAMVTILYRFAKDSGYDVGVISNNNLAAYKDAAKVSASMKDAMNWAVDCGFVSGTASKMLNPQGSTTRGACAKILATFHDWYDIG